ncbi:DNA-methyltransferase [Glycomyces salinus]|uniref:DNA-methyltransferase n=1 Tax=Glycomyces salinus TaxID=980294 RepID=UPI0018EC5AD0|nr:site-specific DNA-methyltransferase [Glycomyces salinus]
MSTRRDRLPLGQILQGDARERLSELPDSSVDCVITSPPYFALRDYGHPGQLGLESDVDGWVRALVGICRQLARVLKPGGALWLNVGDGYSNHIRQGVPPKGLLLGPQRLALALNEDGWIMRNQIIWAKTNPIPSSVADRFSCGHEVLFLLVRSRRYFFDLDAVRVPPRSMAGRRTDVEGYRYLPDDALPEGGGVDDNRGLNRMKGSGKVAHPLGKNPTDVWQLSTAAYRGEHFATFPLGLVETPLLATCPEKACAECGTPWVREKVDRSQHPPRLGQLRPACTCDAGTVPGVVLDPFMSSGTVALAAEMHGRDWIGCELNPVYVALARSRLAEWRAEHRPSSARESRSP